MVLADVLLSPLGLVALAALVPLALLYLVRPDPERTELPTLRFLVEEEGRDSTNPLLERLRRNLLLVLQALVVVALALALATPYVTVPQSEAVDRTVLVVDTSASMATETGSGTRFAAALAAASGEVTGTTSVVAAGPSPRVVLRDGSRRAAEEALSSLSVTDAGGDLRAALAQASALADENARIVVLSDFAGDTAWRDEVTAARARGLSVALRQFDGGGGDNVGIVGRSFSGSEVTLTVRNFGDRRATRTLSLGRERRRVTLAPGDLATVTLPVPAGGGEARLTPGDSFPTDDVAYVAAPADATVDVLLFTNDRNRYLVTALEVVDAVSLTVAEPPTTVDREYDVVLYGDVEPDRLLRGSVRTGRETVEAGGGAGVLAAREMPTDTYGDLLLIEPERVGTAPTVGEVADDELTRDIDFPPPGEYVNGSLRRGRSLVATGEGAPLLAVDDRGAGRVLYYGYVDESSPFKFNYQYPVFWKRAAFYLAGREPLPELNRATNERLTFANETTVVTPSGETTGRSVPLVEAGFYRVGDRRVGASLYSASESDVAADPIARGGDGGGVSAGTEERRVPRPLDGPVALAALALLVVELGYLRRRGDL
ncbi:MAG: BatA domain-containing protein [Haloferacaceae archaeon]